MSAARSLPCDPEIERRAEALALLRISIQLHERARRDVDDAIDALAAALDRAVDASAHYTELGETLLAATLLYARLRDGAGL